jgi:hypothetical protein
MHEAVQVFIKILMLATQLLIIHILLAFCGLWSWYGHFLGCEQFDYNSHPREKGLSMGIRLSGRIR